MPKTKKYKEVTSVEFPVVNEIASPLDKVFMHAPAVAMTTLLGIVAYNLYRADNLLWITITVTILFIISREIMIYELKKTSDAISKLVEHLIKSYHYWSDEALKSKAELTRRDMEKKVE